MTLLHAASELGVHVTHNPNDTYSFVGSGIPASLAYIGPSKDIETGRNFGFGLVRKTVKRRVYQSRAEAWRAAAEYDIRPCKCCA